MELYCTRPGCARPVNLFPDLDNPATLKSAPQKFCTACGMPLILAGRYVPIRLLGRGGFGAAFLARDRYTPAMRQCVVKQFQPSGDLTPEQMKLAQSLFEREGQVLEELGSHPQIPDLLAFFEQETPGQIPGKSDRFFYLVQEFIDGQNMEEELAQKGQFSQTEVLELLIEVLKILKFVHENGSIHRDIKPSNIMRRRDGRVYLLDFGAVKQVTGGAAVGQSARSTGIYSMGFAPPEQMQGNVVYPATDLYALAVTCLMLLTGKDPTDLYEAYNNSWNWRSYATVSDRIAAIFDRMLLPTPSQRFQSADEVIAALKAALGAPAAAPAAAPAPSSPRATALQPTPSPSPAAATAPSLASAPASKKPAIAKSRPSRPPLSIVAYLGGAAFTGFESGLAAIALASLIGTLTSSTFWVGLFGIVGILLFAQWQRWIERVDLVVIAAISLALVLFVPLLQKESVLNPIAQLLQLVGHPTQVILAIALFFALVTVAIAIVFRLIYSVLSRLL